MSDFYWLNPVFDGLHSSTLPIAAKLTFSLEDKPEHKKSLHLYHSSPILRTPEGEIPTAAFALNSVGAVEAFNRVVRSLTPFGDEVLQVEVTACVDGMSPIDIIRNIATHGGITAGLWLHVAACCMAANQTVRFTAISDDIETACPLHLVANEYAKRQGVMGALQAPVGHKDLQYVISATDPELTTEEIEEVLDTYYLSIVQALQRSPFPLRIETGHSFKIHQYGSIIAMEHRRRDVIIVISLKQSKELA